MSIKSLIEKLRAQAEQEVKGQTAIVAHVGKLLVADQCMCPRCDEYMTLVALPVRLRIGSLACRSCGMIARVHTHSSEDPDVLPFHIHGGSVANSLDRLQRGHQPDLIFVMLAKDRATVWFLPKGDQFPDLYTPRAIKPGQEQHSLLNLNAYQDMLQRMRLRSERPRLRTAPTKNGRKGTAKARGEGRAAQHA